MKQKFFKMQGTGNDFILFPFPRNAADLNDSQLRQLCQRKFGIGADGVIFVWKEAEQWYWDFYNDDASQADFCGNGARCVVRYMSEQEQTEKMLQWKSLGGLEFQGRWEAESGLAVVEWAVENVADFDLSAEELLLVKELLIQVPHSYVKCVVVGVPHLCLVSLEKWSEVHKQSFIDSLRAKKPSFFKKANITWVSVKAAEVVTFERGVEAETLACGSGALSAFLAWQEHDVCSERKMNFPGGVLTVQREGRKLFLRGEAKHSFQGEWGS